VKEICLVARLALAAVFVVAGGSKLRDPRGFRTTLLGLRLPARPAGALAVVVPVWEVGTAAILVAGWWPALGAASAAVLACLFVVSAARARRSGRDVPCNCFGTARESLGRTTVIRASMLFALSMVVAAAAAAGDAGWRPGALGDWTASVAGSLGVVVLGRYGLIALSWNDGVVSARTRALR
jgi:uncharacterized membrane protein YphA (DoxX/SURF4 family)